MIDSSVSIWQSSWCSIVKLSFWATTALPQAGQVSALCLFTLSLSKFDFFGIITLISLILSILYPQDCNSLILPNLSKFNAKLDFWDTTALPQAGQVSGLCLFTLSLWKLNFFGIITLNFLIFSSISPILSNLSKLNLKLDFWYTTALPQAGQVSGLCLFTLSLEIRFLRDYYLDFSHPLNFISSRLYFSYFSKIIKV